MPVPTRLNMGPSNICPNPIMGPTEAVDDFRLKLKANSYAYQKRKAINYMSWLFHVALFRFSVLVVHCSRCLHAFVLVVFVAFSVEMTMLTVVFSLHVTLIELK